MQRYQKILLALLIFTLGGFIPPVEAQRRRPAINNNVNTSRILQRLDGDFSRYRQSLTDALAATGRVRGRARTDEINRYAADFETALADFRERNQNRSANERDAQNLLGAAARIERFMLDNPLTERAQSDWQFVKRDLDDLARTYNVAWDWNNPQYSGGNYDNNAGNSGNNNNQQFYGDPLTGTYRIDATRSDDAQRIADEATRTLPVNGRQDAYQNLLTRLESPDGLALDRRNRTVSIASTRAPQVSFEADGTTRSETLDNGVTLRTRAALLNDALEVQTTGDGGNQYYVKFESLENGRALRVTRRLDDPRLRRQFTISSYYTKVDQTARLDISETGIGGVNSSGGVTGTGNNNSPDDFYIVNDTRVLATLNQGFSTQDARENDRFTMTVVTPAQYRGAIIEGYITGVERSGRATGRSQLTFNFERIRLNGSSHEFSGAVESVRTQGGEDVRVDNEGTVRENENRTTTTAKRAGVGSAVGAIIGAIAGGGKGAAIGAIVGAGAGAGSVYAQGRDDLVLPPGTEVTIRASAPRR